MSHKNYSPIFYSSEKLAELAKFVADTDNIEKSPSNQEANISRSTPIKNVSHKNKVEPSVNPLFSMKPVDEVVHNSKKQINKIVPSINIVDKMDLDIHETKDNSFMFTVSSAGFHCGNFSEFKLDEKVFLPKHNSKRGITVLYLVNDLKRFHAWNFDFYKSSTKLATNRNFISLLRRLPGGTYFAMSIKDDAYQNLFEGTKNFLARIIGCKSIWRLNYRNSWCAIVYKKTEKSFEVVSESHNPGGIALAQYSINKNSFKPKDYLQKPYSDKIYSESLSQIIPNIDTKEVENVTPKDTNTEIDKSIDNITKEVQELKKLVLEQTKLINQLIESNKDE